MSANFASYICMYMNVCDVFFHEAVVVYFIISNFLFKEDNSLSKKIA